MDYPKTKIYFDGSHYIGIPQLIKNLKKKMIVKKVEDEKKQEFEKVYKENLSKSKKEKKEILENEIIKHFENKKQAKDYVERNLERKEIRLYNDKIDIILNSPTFRSPDCEGFLFCSVQGKIKHIIQNKPLPLMKDILIRYYV